MVVCGTQYGRDPTAPLTMGLILELTRNIGRENARMHAGEPWQKHIGIEIEGKTLGIVGLGKLGTKIAGLAKAFGMNVIAWSPNLTPERCEAAGVGYATREQLFATADIITIHMVLSQRSRGLVGRDDLARMKPTAFLVNTARGPIVDEAALLEILQRQEDRRRRHRRVLGRTAADRSSVPQTRQSRADAASRLRHRGELPRPLQPDGRVHRRLAQGRAAAAAGLKPHEVSAGAIVCARDCRRDRANPLRHEGWAGCQSSSRLALTFDPARASRHHRNHVFACQKAADPGRQMKRRLGAQHLRPAREANP